MGGRPPKVSDDEILREIALSRGPVVTAPEMAERVGINNSGMNKRLSELVEEGYLHRREVGASAVVYWLTDEGRDRIARMAE